MRSKAGNGIRWSALALACAGLAACGGGSSGSGGSGSGDGSFVATAVNNPTTGSEPNVDATSVNEVLTAALALLAASRGIETMGVGEFDSGDEPQDPVTEDCGTGEATTEIDEGGGERTFTTTFDQCYFNSSPDFLFDGRFSQVSSTVGSATTGSLEVGQGPTAGLFVFQNASGLTSVQMLTTGEALTFTDDAAGLDVTLSNASMVVAEGNRPSEGGTYSPQRGFGLLLGTDVALEIHSEDSGANVAQDLSGTFSFRTSGLNAPCAMNRSVGVVSTTGDPILLDVGGQVVGGTLSVVGAGGTAEVEFFPDGTVQVRPPVGIGDEFTPAEIEALCGIY
ncbi:MAG TPA: hypothetical protein VJM11_15330 [Nevskiaceae bacterium]|nr:hypothetical protein [Nevskiaceae bacterium]